MLHSFTDLSRLLDTIVDGVVAGLWGLLVLGFLVAAFGIANTLTMNVLEQTREIALLRVVAMTRWQVRKLILSASGHHRRDRPGHGKHCRREHGLHHQPLHRCRCWDIPWLFRCTGRCWSAVSPPRWRSCCWPPGPPPSARRDSIC